MHISPINPLDRPVCTNLETSSRTERADDGDVRLIDADADESIDVVVSEFFEEVQFFLNGSSHLTLRPSSMVSQTITIDK